MMYHINPDDTTQILDENDVHVEMPYCEPCVKSLPSWGKLRFALGDWFLEVNVIPQSVEDPLPIDTPFLFASKHDLPEKDVDGLTDFDRLRDFVGKCMRRDPLR
jgi:hypothetical protein